jgi:subtilisin family serine protease
VDVAAARRHPSWGDDVAATSQDDREADFSSFGQCVDIWAPGTGIPTTERGGGMALGTGTSYSAPHVAGTAGLFLSQNPGASAADVEAALQASAAPPRWFGPQRRAS